METVKYRRLPGWHTGLFTRDSLWSADDHILLVQSSGYVERYRRYYFKDIQGITVIPTPRSYRLALAIGTPLLLVAVVAVTSIAKMIQPEWAIFGGIFGMPLLLGFVVNWVRGKSCRTTVYTAVADINLTPLSRLRPTLRAVTRIAELVDICQGPLDRTRLNLVAEGPAANILHRKTHVDRSAKRGALAYGRSPDVAGELKAKQSTLWLASLGVAELLQGLAALALLLIGGGAVRQATFFVLLILSLLAASMGLARGGRPLKYGGIVALSHTLVVGLGTYVAFYAAVISNAMKHPASTPDFTFTNALEPTLPVTKIVLTMSVAGSLLLFIYCVVVLIRGRTR